MADEISELRIADAEIRRDVAGVREHAARMQTEVTYKADRDELHKFKEAIFERMETLVAKVVVEQEGKMTDRMKVVGHETAEIIRAEVNRALNERDALEAAAKEKSKKRAVEDDDVDDKSKTHLTPKQAAWIAFASLAFGLFLSEYAVPILIRLATQTFTGG